MYLTQQALLQISLKCISSFLSSFFLFPALNPARLSSSSEYTGRRGDSQQKSSPWPGSHLFPSVYLPFGDRDVGEGFVVLFHNRFFKFSIIWSIYKVGKGKIVLNKTKATKSYFGGKILNPVFIPNTNGLAVVGCGYTVLLFLDICAEI